MTRGIGVRGLAGVAVVLAGVLAVAQVVIPAATPEQRLPRDANTRRVVKHLQALQDIADGNDGTRAAGTSGYTASRDYVVSVLQEAGYHPEVQEFRFATDSGEEIPSWNVIAETASGDRHHVVMAGAHLDSIPGGPGIDDNGTGTSALLATAEKLATARPVNRVRFAWWGAEEHNLQGSNHYVADLADAGRLGEVAVYLNFDMIGSSNHVDLVYDGGSPFPEGTEGTESPEGSEAVRGPEGPGAVEKVFRDYFASRSLPLQQTPLDGRSDYKAFVEHGVPVGGLFTGAEGLKTEEEAATFGGEPFEAYEPCYHDSCDDLDHLDLATLGRMSGAVSYAVERLAGLTTRQ